MNIGTDPESLIAEGYLFITISPPYSWEIYQYWKEVKKEMDTEVEVKEIDNKYDEETTIVDHHERKSKRLGRFEY